jgi:hypothetical protein
MRNLILKMSISVDGFVGDQEATAWTVETVWNASLSLRDFRRPNRQMHMAFDFKRNLAAREIPRFRDYRHRPADLPRIHHQNGPADMAEKLPPTA